MFLIIFYPILIDLCFNAEIPKLWAGPPGGPQQYCMWGTLIIEIQYVQFHIYLNLVTLTGNMRWLVCGSTHYCFCIEVCVKVAGWSLIGLSNLHMTW